MTHKAGIAVRLGQSLSNHASPNGMEIPAISSIAPNKKNMLPILLLLGVMALCASMSRAQAVRWDVPIWTTNQSQPIPGGFYPVVAIPNATIAICTGTPCTLATTYTNASAVTPCPTTAQLTRGTSTACYAISDSNGGAGAWLLPGNYQYTVSTPYATSGPYPFGVDAGGAYLPLAGGTLSGALTASGGVSATTLAASGGITGSLTGAASQNVLKAGDAMSGSLQIGASGNALGLSGTGNYLGAQPLNHASFLEDGINPATWWTFTNSFTNSESEVYAGMVVPNTSTQSQATSLAGVNIVNSNFTNGVGVYGAGVCNTNGAHCWGGNFLVSDKATTAPSSLMWGIEADNNVYNATTTGYAFNAIGYMEAQSTKMIAMEISRPVQGGGCTTCAWTGGVQVEEGAVMPQAVTGAPPYGVGLLLNPVTFGTSSQNSQLIGMVSRDSGGVLNHINMYGDPDGNLQFCTNNEFESSTNNCSGVDGAGNINTKGNFQVTPSPGVSHIVVPNGTVGYKGASSSNYVQLSDNTVTNGHCPQWGVNGQLTDSGAACGAGGGAFSAITAGTNTSAAMVVGTGGSISVSGSGTINANQIASGAAFTGNQGNGTLVQHSTGAVTTGNCAKFDANGNTVDSGAGCGSGTLPSATDTFNGVKVSGAGTGTIITTAQGGTWEGVINGGADNAGSVDAGTILNAQTTAACSGATPVRIHLAAGTYKVNSGWTIAATSTTCKNMVIEGDGSANTIIQSNCSGGVNYVVGWINSTSPAAEHFNGPTFRHLTIKNTGGSACAVGLLLSQTAMFKVEDMVISGFAGQTYATGTIASTGATVTGTGTTFTAAMVHGFIETTTGNITTRSEVCAFASATSLTLCATSFPSGDISGGTSYGLAYGGDGLACDPGYGISGSPFTQYGTIKDVYAPGNLIGIHAWGTTSASSAGCSRIQVTGNAGYISPSPGSRVTDAVGIYLGKHSDTWEISSAINNTAVCIVNDAGHANWINGAKCENGGSYAPVTTCNAGVGIQACTASWEVSSDTSGNGWNTTFTAPYSYKTGTVFQYDNAAGAFNSSILAPRDLSGGYTQHYYFYGTTTCPADASGIPIIISAYDCNHQLVAQTVN